MDSLVRWHMEKQICHAYQGESDRSTTLHGHNHFLLTLITEGSGIQTLNGKEIVFHENDMFLLSPADFHKNTLLPGQSFSYYGVKFSYELMDARLSEVCALDKLPLYLRLPESAAQTAKTIFAQLVAECRDGQEQVGSRAYLQAMVEQLIILALRQIKQDRFVQPEAFSNRVLGYLYSHFSESITVADAAAYMGYTPNYFNTCFRKHMGMPFGEYLSDMRLNYAENLLRSGTVSATEIAYEAGFASLSYFSRCFQKKYKLAPREYRKYWQEKNQQEDAK